MSSEPSGSSLLEQLVESFMDQQRRGERPSVEEYVRNHPELAGQLRDVLPALELIEEFVSAAGPVTGPYRPHESDFGAMPPQLGEFRILREIGRGGMGVVYEAVQGSLGRHVALKVLPPQLQTNEVFLERFRREARAAAGLHHTSIVPVFGVGEHDGLHYYAMQFIRGQTLESVLHELRRFRHGDRASPVNRVVRELSAVSRTLLCGRFETNVPARNGSGDVPPADRMPPTSSLSVRSDIGDASPRSSGFGRAQYFRNVAEIGVQVAEALAYAHGQGVTHRDIKPSNLMLDPGGIVWVTDFGLAKVEGSADLTTPGDVLGTLRYMAPEQLEGEADGRSDVYSLGITLYELATLRLAFDDPVRGRLLDHIRNREPSPPRRIESQIPRDLEKIILKAIAKEPLRRYQTAAELAADLRRFLLDRPVHARPAGPVERAWRWVARRRKVILVGVCAAVTAVTLLLGVLAARDAVRRSTAQSQARDFLSALQTRDHATIQSLLTEDGRRNYTEHMFEFFMPGDGELPRKIHVNQAEVTGDSARMTGVVQGPGSPLEFVLQLKREGGNWRVDSLAASNEALNFSVHPPAFAGPPVLLGAQEPTVEPPLEAFGVDGFGSLWKTELGVNHEPAGAVLKRLSGELDLSLVHIEGLQGVLERRVTLPPRVRGRLEAIEEVCGQLDLHPAYEDHHESTRLVLKPGKRPRPVSFAGPFLIEVTDVVQFPPYATGYVRLTVRGHGLPAGLISRFENRIEMGPVKGTVGSFLDDTGTGYGDNGMIIPKGVVRFRHVVPLKNLIKSVSAVSLDGYVPLRLPTRVESLRFDPPAAETTKQSGNIRVTLAGVGENDPCGLSLVVNGAGMRDVRVAAFDIAGKPLAFTSTSESGSDGYAELRRTLTRRPAAIEVAVVAETEQLRFPFTLGPVALPRFAEMPDALTLAKFPEAGPVSVQFVAISKKEFGRDVRVKVTNESNKAIRHVDVELTYLDANGRPISEHPDFPPFPAHSSVRGREGGVLVPVGVTSEVSAPAALVPEKTERVGVKVRRVEFADATSWQAK